MRKLKKGDKVKIKDDLIVDNYYSDVLFVDAMKEYLGKTVTIRDILDDMSYEIEEDNERFQWGEAMFEEKIKCNTIIDII